MGLFDTIHFPEPLHVPGFSRPVTETQTKLFANAMRNYSVGSILPEAPVLIGVVEDFIWCAPEPGEHQGKQHPIYFVIWHRVLAGIYLDAEAAQQRLHSVDRLDLIEWLDSAQNDAQKWKQRYWRLLSDIKELHRHQSEPEPSDPVRLSKFESTALLCPFWLTSDEIGKINCEGQCFGAPCN